LGFLEVRVDGFERLQRDHGAVVGENAGHDLPFQFSIAARFGAMKFKAVIGPGEASS
jgi:hypothetical protein